MKICSMAFESIHTTRYVEWFLKNKHEVHWATYRPRDSIKGASTPATLMEAMACGVPVIVSREKAITEFISNGINGEVVDPNDLTQIAEKTVKLLTSTETRKLYGSRGHELVMKVANMDVEMKKIESLYCKLIEDRKR